MTEFKYKPFTGKKKWYHDNGKPSAEFYLKDDMFHGIDKGYLQNGKMLFLQKWKGNATNGPKFIFNYK